MRVIVYKHPFYYYRYPTGPKVIAHLMGMPNNEVADVHATILYMLQELTTDKQILIKTLKTFYHDYTIRV